MKFLDSLQTLQSMFFKIGPPTLTNMEYMEFIQFMLYMQCIGSLRAPYAPATFRTRTGVKNREKLLSGGQHGRSTPIGDESQQGVYHKTTTQS
jgi:hypothetical protein